MPRFNLVELVPEAFGLTVEAQKASNLGEVKDANAAGLKGHCCRSSTLAGLGHSYFDISRALAILKQKELEAECRELAAALACAELDAID
jgi:hypothetical protein